MLCSSHIKFISIAIARCHSAIFSCIFSRFSIQVCSYLFLHRGGIILSANCYLNDVCLFMTDLGTCTGACQRTPRTYRY